MSMDIHAFREQLDREGMSYFERIFSNLPESDRTMIDFCVKQSEGGNSLALYMLSELYEYDALQAARLYYGASVGDSYACWKLGSYHLQGKYVFHSDLPLARQFLDRAKESPWQHIAEAAKDELRCLTAPLKDFELGYYDLERYNGKDEVVAVPYQVKRIHADAFRKNKTVKKVILPSSVTHIGACAFFDCENLEEVVLREGLTVIDWMAFGGCTSLKQIELPQSLQVIGESSFWNCKQLEQITVHENVSEIEKEAFYDSGLKQITLQTGVRRIGKGAFRNTPLKYIICPETLEEVDVNAFKDCRNLERVDLSSLHYHLKRKMTVRRGNDAFSNAPIKTEYLAEQNKWLIHRGGQTDMKMILTEPALPSREQESGHFVRYSESDGMIWQI